MNTPLETGIQAAKGALTQADLNEVSRHLVSMRATRGSYQDKYKKSLLQVQQGWSGTVSVGDIAASQPLAGYSAGEDCVIDSLAEIVSDLSLHRAPAPSPCALCRTDNLKEKPKASVLMSCGHDSTIHRKRGDQLGQPHEGQSTGGVPKGIC